MLELLVALGSIVRGTQHFAVGQGGCATLRPRSYVVGIHLGLLIDICLFRVLTDNAERTVRYSRGLGLLGLPLISEVFRLAVKQPDRQQLRVRLAAAAQHVLVDAPIVLYRGVAEKLIDLNV